MSELLLAYAWIDLLKQFGEGNSAGWLLFGLCGNVCFFTRFLIQWLHSEKHGESRIPVIFWWQSIAGTLILLTYFTHRRDPIGMLGYIVNIVPYTRNLMLVYRKRRMEELAGFAPVAGGQSNGH